MKLINRDKFINDMFNFYIENGWNPRDIHFSLLDVQSNIDSPEFEVKAIPIEFIEKKCRELELYEYLCLDELLGIQMLLRDWEKENDSDDTIRI